MKVGTRVAAFATRTRLGGPDKEVAVVMEIKESQTYPGEFWLWIVDGGVTGYESCKVENELVERISKSGWLACAGTPGSWSKLEISANEMKRVYKVLEVK